MYQFKCDRDSILHYGIPGRTHIHGSIAASMNFTLSDAIILFLLNIKALRQLSSEDLIIF